MNDEVTGRDSDAPATSQRAWGERYDRTLMNTFGHPRRVFVRGRGADVWDADGRHYTDLLAGLAVHALGHAHPAVLEAISGQAATLGHISNLFASPPQIELGERLVGLATLDAPGTPARVFFANSGTEANEAAFKLSRRTGRGRIVAMEGSFHGRTMGALAITHNEHYREPFEPLPGEIVWVPYGDVPALERAVDETVAAVVLEPVQGENGVVEPGPDFLPAARRITAAHGALLWIDEVQTGLCRCGRWFAHQRAGIAPDVITVAKGLANGYPIGACIALGDAAGLFGPGQHGTTFGGNPIACAVGCAVLGVMADERLADRSEELGAHFAGAVMALGDPRIDLVRGIVLNRPIAAGAADAALDAGWIINAPRPSVLRLAPPLIVTAGQLDAFVAALPGLLDTAQERS